MSIMQQPCDACGVLVKAVNVFRCRRRGAVDPRVPVGTFNQGSKMVDGLPMGENFVSGALCDSCSGKVREYLRTMVAK